MTAADVAYLILTYLAGAAVIGIGVVIILIIAVRLIARIYRRKDE